MFLDLPLAISIVKESIHRISVDENILTNDFQCHHASKPSNATLATHSRILFLSSQYRRHQSKHLNIHQSKITQEMGAFQPIISQFLSKRYQSQKRSSISASRGHDLPISSPNTHQHTIKLLGVTTLAAAKPRLSVGVPIPPEMVSTRSRDRNRISPSTTYDSWGEERIELGRRTWGSMSGKREVSWSRSASRRPRCGGERRDLLAAGWWW